ncbi:hypothetical protein PVL29_003926 [Vitis rotundifolia]|uniref:Uncharacterized protein n=1 Tax=Vitis rotundifolia TaxID=103349 RepID=A0AA39A7K0_VITRO|nr:hypothetical protein PVL29_003926 [Vitis rotundifolia]
MRRDESPRMDDGRSGLVGESTRGGLGRKEKWTEKFCLTTCFYVFLGIRTEDFPREIDENLILKVDGFSLLEDLELLKIGLFRKRVSLCVCLEIHILRDLSRVCKKLKVLSSLIRSESDNKLKIGALKMQSFRRKSVIDLHRRCTKRVKDMEKEGVKNNNNNSSINNNNNNHRERSGGADDGSLLRASSEPRSTASDFVLQWGNRKRLRCMKIQVKDDSAPVHKTTVRVDRRVVRADKDSLNQPTTTAAATSNGYFNLRHRPSSPQPPPPPPPQRVLRNSENSSAMKGQSNGVRGFSSPARDQDKRGNHHNANNHHHNNDNKSASSETAHDSKKGGGGSSSAGSEAVPPVWPPKFVIALTNKEKEEDFMAIKGSKLPQRPKKRAKFIQRTLNVSLRPP